MEERRIAFHLLGQEFSFYSDAPDEEIEQVLALLREEFTDLENAGHGTVPSTGRLLFGCLRMAARLVRERNRQQGLCAQERHSIEAMIGKLLSHLD